MIDKKKTSSSNKSEKILERNGAYVSDVQAMILLQSPRGGRLILYVIIAFVLSALTWAYFAQIDEVIKGQGKIIPSSKVQQIQNLEGGILKEVLVMEGQVVQKGVSLLLLEDIQFSAELQKNSYEAISMQAAIERLNTEALGVKLEFSQNLEENYPDLVAQQRRLAKVRAENLQNQIDVLVLTKKEKEANLAQLKQKLVNAKRKYELATKEYNTLAPLLRNRAVAEIDVLRAEQKVAEAKSIMDDAIYVIPETQTAILEVQERIDQTVTGFNEKARGEIADLVAKSKGLLALQKSLQDKVSRTVIKSPVHGTIKKNYVDTVGGTIRPGMTMMEIVPLDDKLLVETKIAPKDVGFIRVGQKAKVKLSAYDFAVYGGIEGKVARVSADSITDDKGKTYFVIMVSIPQNFIGELKDKHLVIPGMQAEVDVVVTKRRLIDYLLRPLLKSKYI